MSSGAGDSIATVENAFHRVNGVKSELDEEESDQDLLLRQQWQEQALLPLKEDLIDWLKNILDVNITVENFMEVLDSGCILCKLGCLIQKKTDDSKSNNGQNKPKYSLRYKENASSGSWFARDNIANFLAWCRSYGVREDCMFETEGLVSHRSHKEVILCLLELARLSARFGLEPPSIIKLEMDIDSKPRKRLSSASVVDGPQPATGKKNLSKTASVDSLDKKVLGVTGQCSCAEKLKVQCLSDGKYNIAGKNVLVRLLKGRHLMVRVGGGWDTLEHYIATHDPCRFVEFKRKGLNCRPVSSKAGKADFMLVKGNYKPAKSKKA